VQRLWVLNRELTRPWSQLPRVIGHLARLLPELAGLLLAEHSQLTVPVCTEDLTLHGCRLLAEAAGMLLDVAPPLADAADRPVDLCLQPGAGAVVHWQADVALDLRLRPVEASTDTAIHFHHRHLHGGLGIPELTRRFDRALRSTLRLRHGPSRRPFNLTHRGVEVGLSVPFLRRWEHAFDGLCLRYVPLDRGWLGRSRLIRVAGW
jgi:hypothetical protein